MSVNSEALRIMAGEALSYFEHRRRHDGSGYWALEEGAPEWVRKLAFAAHNEGEMLPEDFRYLFIVEVLEALAEDPEEPDIVTDVYTSELLRWLEASPSYRAGFVDAAVSEFGWNGLFEALRAGQLREKEEVLGIVRAFLEKKIEEGEED